jgi:outer membrane protein TolC
MPNALWALLLLAAAPANPSAPELALARITLEEAVRRAMLKNVATEVARFEIRRAEGLLAQARSASIPTLAGAGTYTRLDSDRILQGDVPRVILSKDQLNANATLAVPLLVPQRWAQWSHGADNLDVARASEEDVRRLTAIFTARTYLSVVAQKRVIDATARARDTARAHYVFARTRREGGVGNRVDEVRAEQELATDEAQVEIAYAALTRAREALGAIVGGDAPLDTVDDPVLPDAPPQPAGMLDAEALRKDVQAAKARTSAADHLDRDSWLDYLPQVLGVGQATYQNPPSLTLPLRSWQLQLLLSVPIYDGGFRSGQAKERQALAGEARSQLDGLLRQARSDVRVSYEVLRRADRALLEARRAAQRAAEALQLANRAYQAGATSNLEVIDAERRARDAENVAIISEDAVRQARLDLLAATGHFP